MSLYKFIYYNSLTNLNWSMIITISDTCYPYLKCFIDSFLMDNDHIEIRLIRLT